MATGKQSALFFPTLPPWIFLAAITVLLMHGPPAAAEILPGQQGRNYRAGNVEESRTVAWEPAAGDRTPRPPSRRRVRVGLYENRPKIFTGENGSAAGIFAGILEEIAQREGWQLVWEPCTWAACLADLENGRLDLMPDVAFSPAREKTLSFHQEEVLESWSQVYADRKKPVKTWSDLDGRRLALLAGSIQQDSLEQMLSGFGYTTTLVEANSYEKAFALAACGDVDAVVSNHLFGNFYCQTYGLDRTAIVFEPVSLYFASGKGISPDLLAAVDRNLLAMKTEPGSVYYRELALWMERPPRVVLPRYLVWTAMSIGGLLALAFLLILLLRVQVRCRTRHLAVINETLRESEEKFRALFQNHSAVKLLIDPDTGSIIEANEAAVSYYGWPAAQLRQMRIQDINLLPLSPPEAETENPEAVHPRQGAVQHRLADGSVRDVEVFSSRIDLRGKTLLHIIIHDITAHRKLEEQYRQAQKMEAVGRLAGGVAHDFNNMLTVILGYSDMALNHVDRSEPLYANLQEIIKAGNRTADITRQLLAFARKQEISPRLLDLNGTLESMLKMLRRLIGEDVELAWLPGAGIWPVMIDPSQVDQILANLCINARDAITGIGKITIETANITFEDTGGAGRADMLPGDFVLLAVSDNGCGMDRETLAHLFEPFFTTKGEGQGTGLGLATVHGIVKQNQGFINIYTEPGKGTVFKIYLPRHAGATDPGACPEETPIPMGEGETILLVEDDPALLRLTRIILEELGYRMLAASTPAGAMELAREYAGSIGLLLTDVVMPGMTGRDLAARLQGRQPALKVLYMSGYTPNVLAHRLDPGEPCIEKPFTRKELARKVRAALEAAAGDEGAAGR